jgi:pyrrolidone-carboxylate peptidase
VLRVLVTGFRPWTGVSYNPSGVVAERLKGRRISGAGGYPHTANVRGVVLDVAWGDGKGPGGTAVHSAAAVLSQEAAAYEPHLIVSFGVLAGVPYTFDVERQAADESAGKDVLGNPPDTSRMHPELPKVLRLTFAARKIKEALDGMLPKPFKVVSEKGLGAYLCERIAYEGARLQRERAPQKGDTKDEKQSWTWASGFIHVPDPLFAVAGSSAVDPNKLSADERKQLHDYEDIIVQAATLAVRTALGQLPKDVE